MTRTNQATKNALEELKSNFGKGRQFSTSDEDLRRIKKEIGREMLRSRINRLKFLKK